MSLGIQRESVGSFDPSVVVNSQKRNVALLITGLVFLAVSLFIFYFIVPTGALLILGACAVVTPGLFLIILAAVLIGRGKRDLSIARENQTICQENQKLRKKLKKQSQDLERQSQDLTRLQGVLQELVSPSGKGEHEFVFGSFVESTQNVYAESNKFLLFENQRLLQKISELQKSLPATKN